MAGGRLSVLAVDDEPRVLADLQRMLEQSPLVDVVDTAAGAREALVKLSAGRYDGLFLDVHMPEIKGMALARLLRRFTDPPGVVFVSGHPSAAVEAFEVEALDFLVKPVARERLENALRRIDHHTDARLAAGNGTAPLPPRPRTLSAPDVVAVDVPGADAKRVLKLESVLFVEASGDYARIVADDGSYLLRVPLATLEAEWDVAGFTRVHRRHLVNLRRAVSLRAQANGTAALALDDGTEVPVARRHVAALRRRLHA